MLVSHRKKFIYLKTRKTGGTSVEVALEPFALPEGERAEADDTQTEMIETEAGIVGARSRQASRSQYYNHMSAKHLSQMLPADVWSGYAKICNVRNPWDKVVSKFHWARRKSPPQSREQAVTGFREWIATTKDFGEDIDIYTIDGELVADHVIRYQHLDADFAKVCEALDIPVEPLPKYKAKARGRSERVPYVDYYDDSARELVAKLFVREIEIFGWTFGDDL
ncbi:MAG: hypothetical protein AcusKO_32070 [Acuticoccus sp.]